MASELLSHPAVASNIELLSAWIDGQMAYRGQPGLSIGIGYDQALIWARGFGYADLDQKTPATPDTIYRIASITKLFTATALLQLRDGGALQLDDPIARHLPWFAIGNRAADAPPITIRHLLTHTAGLPREAAFPYWGDSNFPTAEQIRATLPQQEAILSPDTQWKYSNLGLTLAGDIVEAVAGQPYAAYIHQQILEPLGMQDTYVESIDPDHPHLATGYGRRLPDGSRSRSPYSDCRGITAAANMATTVNDLARFAMLQLRNGPAGGAQILRGSTLREMQRAHWLQEDWQAGRGLGFYVWRRNDKTYVGHGGALQGYRTDMQICPAEKTFAIVFTNADDGTPLMYMEKIFDWVFPALAEATTPEKTPADSADWQRYVGKYRNAWGDRQVIVLKDELVVIDPSQPEPLLGMDKLIPLREHTFRIEATNGFSAHGELAVFELDADGRVQRVKIGENYAYPVAAW